TQRRMRRILMPPTQSAVSAGMAARGRRGPGAGRLMNCRKSRSSARKPPGACWTGFGCLGIVSVQLSGRLFELSVQKGGHDGTYAKQRVFHGRLVLAPWRMQYKIGD